MVLPPSKSINVFCYGTDEDRTFQNTLKRYLTILERLGLVTQWHAHDIQPGKDKAEEIYAHLKAADIILLLISPYFIASDYCYHVLIPQTQQRNEEGKVLVVPIILSPTLLEGTLIHNYESLPKGKAITQWHRRADAFSNITDHLLQKVNLLLSERWLSESNTFFEAKLYEQALEACEQAIRLNKNNIDALTSKGSILWNCGYYAEALKVYEHIIHFDPDNILAYMNIAYILQNLGRYEEAILACNQAIRLEPANHIAYLIKARLYEFLANQMYGKVKELKYEKGANYLTNKHFILSSDGH